MRFDEKKELILLASLLVFTVVLGASFSTVAFGAEDNVTVDVNITTLSEITVTPSAINWTGLTVGQAGGTRSINVKNTGSVNVTNLYAFITTIENETTRPYGSDQASDYSAGGVLVFHNESDSQFYWAGRLEWNWTEAISNLQYTESLVDTNSRAARGFFRNASNSYVWVAGNGTSGRCNETGAVFAIEDLTDDGTPGTRTPNSTLITRDGANSEWGFFSVDRPTSFLNGMCVAVNTTCEKIFVYKYDKRSGFTSCANSKYINDQQIAPNDIEQVTADVWIPRGLPSGNMTQAIWSFVAT